MSSPSPDAQKQQPPDHTYQPADAVVSDHHVVHHVCPCLEKTPIDATAKIVADYPCQQQQPQQQRPQTPIHHVHPTCVCHHHHHNEETPCVGGDGGKIEVPGTQSVVRGKLDADDRIEVSPLPPALPPRPPLRPRFEGHGTLRDLQYSRDVGGGGGIRKYVFWCCVCGGLAVIVGSLFMGVYFLLRSYTSTLGYFETIPTFVPAVMLILTGLCVMSLARRKNRYSYLIKVCGVCCLVCALTCVLVTITTTVIHMNRLQTLRECVYTQKTRTCTCYSVLLEAHAATDEGMRFVFDSTPDCEVIHGALYSCLRAMFGLSVSGILVCIFSCMLVYQLLSHEKKKMYWEQLELRCRSFYQQHGAPASSHGSVRGGPPAPSSTYCSCCEECRYPSIGPAGPRVFPWDSHHSTDRFWSPSRVGNFYSPNPGEEMAPVNMTAHVRERPLSGWSWRRLPWSRSAAPVESHRDNSLTYQGATSSADSQYGFSNRSGGESNTPVDPGSTGSYSVLDNRPVGGVYVWGPPPPYSNPNSPARRGLHSPSRYHHHVHHHLHGHESHCQQLPTDDQFRSTPTTVDFHPTSRRPHGVVQFPVPKDNYENTTEPEVHHHHQCNNNENSESTDTSSCADRVSHTLPVRKMKKRMDVGSVKSNVQQGNCRGNVQSLFRGEKGFGGEEERKEEEESGYHEPDLRENSGEVQQCRFLPRLQGVENEAFQKQEPSPQKPEATESEVYFADVSSCCNISVRNDGQDSSLYDEALDTQKPRLISLQCVHKQTENEPTAVTASTNQMLQNFQENISSSTVTEDEEYLAQRMGKRQMSTRSRLPFPLPVNGEIGEMNVELLPKDISQNSLCSNVQTPNTESTDDALTPVSGSFPKSECCMGYFPEKENRHRTFSTASLDQFLAPDAQYEVIDEQDAFIRNAKQAPNNFSNLTNTISGLNNYTQNYHVKPNYNNFNNTSGQKNLPPKTLNLNQAPPTSRRNLGSNISTLIQNLGVNPAGLLYGEANSMEDDLHAQGCHSDATMDSGWQSGSEKQEKKEEGDGNTHKPVNV